MVAMHYNWINTVFKEKYKIFIPNETYSRIKGWEAL